MESLEDRVCRTVAEVFGLDLAAVTLQTTNEQVESWDSLNILNLLMAVEEEFGISLSPEEAGRLTSVDGILTLVRSKQ